MSNADVMGRSKMAATARRHLNALCSVTPDRRTGSPGNRTATDYFANVTRTFGGEPEICSFPCMDWSHGSCTLDDGDAVYTIEVSPCSLGCDLVSTVNSAATLDELESLDCSGRILLLTGDLASEQLMPKNFPFYNPESHRKLYATLEQKQPVAIIAATRHNPEAAGALYPFPLIADGDFHIPCAHCSEETGGAIASKTGRTLHLIIDSARRESSAANVIFRLSTGAPRKILVTAHIDAYDNTPGATDNAAGVVVLLLLAELIASDPPSTGVEIVALNGEDHYSAAGQLDYLARYGDDLANVRFVINIDGAGFREGATAYSFYDLSPDVQESAVATFSNYPGLIEGQQWFAGDHSIFLQRDIPAIAFTSARINEFLRSMAHTPKDSPDTVDCTKLVELADALAHLLRTSA